MHDPIPEIVRQRGFFPLSAYLRLRFGEKVRRIPLDAGMDCPNRDGTLGRGGCSYCDPRSFAPNHAGGAEIDAPQAGRLRHNFPLGRLRRLVRSVEGQMLAGMRRAKAGLFVAYFQSRTNTYAPAAALRALYDAATQWPEVVGLAIGTRPDCVPDEVLDLVAEYSARLEVWMEYGLQTANDRTLARINRGHGAAAFVDAVRRTHARGIKVCAHVILGLPGEGTADWRRTADLLAEYSVEGVKLHHLHIVKGTVLEKEYRAARAPVLAAGDYVRAACDFLERLPPETVVFRLVGESRDEAVLVAPKWPEAKPKVLAEIEKEMRRRRSGGKAI